MFPLPLLPQCIFTSWGMLLNKNRNKKPEPAISDSAKHRRYAYKEKGYFSLPLFNIKGKYMDLVFHFGPCLAVPVVLGLCWGSTPQWSPLQDCSCKSVQVWLCISYYMLHKTMNFLGCAFSWETPFHKESSTPFWGWEIIALPCKQGNGTTCTAPPMQRSLIRTCS